MKNIVGLLYDSSSFGVCLKCPITKLLKILYDLAVPNLQIAESLVAASRVYFPDQGSNSGPPLWEAES